ncbi:enoyl-CoA hydratase/isomerase family protein [Vibrio aquaticus]|uniref:3-hydroxyisobutyryl-CoA hydrolase n=1 Tax=Vibrio aquaticus TaxID=2496559 RepID=A0A432D0S4_9VIBR|nr:enoyl-CoA hydratase/isomerase family protein [Vibrio aquaticus]RTZ17509.1 enoyl-CoA hydratase/isomerase family protein [Vibrio aquaticus]
MSGNVHFVELPCSGSPHKIGLVTLNNEASLNALTFDMLVSLKEQLTLWHDDDELVCVVLEGEGSKAFCAGGDVRTMYSVMNESSEADIEAFCSTYFSVEYECDYLIHTYCKPIIAWGQGIVMGGGMGLYMASSHKVVTPDSRLAMPEVSIGLFPDVGATWFLNRLDQGIGLFLGLTGTMVNATDAIALHLADHMVLVNHRESLLEQLQVADWDCVEDTYEVVTEILEGFDSQVETEKPPAQITPYFNHIQHACAAEQLPDVIDRILALAGDEAWLVNAKSSMTSGSPITAHICFRQMTQYQQLSLAECFRLELVLAVNSSLLGEFKEGVRARLIDKDGEPNWRYSTIEQVDVTCINQLFTSIWDDESHPLAKLGHY